MGKRFYTLITSLLLVAATLVFPLHTVRAEEGATSANPIVVVEEQADEEEDAADDGTIDADPVEEIQVGESSPAVEEPVQSDDANDEITDEYLAYLATNDLANSERYVDGVPIARSTASASRMRLLATTVKAPAWSYTDAGWVNGDGQVIVGATTKGIDVSEWNDTIDWGQVKGDGISFAILRVGYSTYEDSEFERNASECERLGIPYGVYVYSYARNADQAAKEADAVIKFLSGHTISYPVYIDIEDTNAQGGLTASEFAALASAFCTRIEMAGYEPGVYSMLSWWESYFTSSVFDNWSKWIAQIYSECEYEGSFRLWQCCWTGTVAGISGNVDLNFEFGEGETVKPEGLVAKNASGSYAHPLAVGEYNIISAMNSSKVVDTYDNAPYAGANIQLWTYTNGGGDRFYLEYDGQGLYTIKNANSGKYLSLSGNSGVFGQNVVQMDYTGSYAQKWIIEANGGSYLIRSAFNTDYVLDVAGQSTADGANIGVWISNGGANQLWSFRSLDYSAVKTVPDSIYTISCASNSNIVLDVEEASTKTGANIGFWTNNGGKNQQFNITYAGNGYYTITGAGSSLALDVSGNSRRVGTNLIQYTLGSSNDNQLWAIVDNGDGSYSIVSKLSGLLVTAEKGVAKGANAGLGPMDYSASQRFSLTPISSSTPVASRPIADGTYVIESSLLNGLVLDVTGNSTSNGANIETWGYNGGANQQWVVAWDSATGSYTFKSVRSGKYLDASGAKAANGTNLIQYTGNVGKNQRWTIVSDGDGYRICSLMNPVFVVDIEGCSSKPGANVELYKANGGANQRFEFIPASSASAETTGRVIANGTYEIALASNSTLVFDVSGESKSDRANVCLWADHNGANQRFTFTWDAAQNAYMITNVNSGYVLDLAGSEAVVGANIQQYHSVGWLDQRWVVTRTPSGFKISSAVNPSYYLCFDSLSPKAGSNVQLGNTSSAVLLDIRAV